MAVKGKKKSRSRGSQARRRPAAAPRPNYGGPAKKRWYETTTGLVLAFLTVAVVGIVAWWFIADNRSEAQELEATQDGIEAYTSALQGLFSNVTPVATDLATASELEDAQLTDQAKQWKNQLSTAQTSVATETPPPGLEALSGLTSQALLLYVQSAELYELLPQLEGNARTEVAAKAAASFQAGTNIFTSAIEILDNERLDNEMDSSGLQTPGTDPDAPAPTAAPTQELEIPTGEEAEQGDE